MGRVAACGAGYAFRYQPVSADNALLTKNKEKKGWKKHFEQVKGAADNIITAMTDSDAPWSLYI